MMTVSVGQIHLGNPAMGGMGRCCALIAGRLPALLAQCLLSDNQWFQYLYVLLPGAVLDLEQHLHNEAPPALSKREDPGSIPGVALGRQAGSYSIPCS